MVGRAARTPVQSRVGRCDLKPGLTLRPTGTSMMPLITSRSSIELETVEEGALRVGDILCLKTPSGRFLVHRLIAFEKAEGGLLTRGDARSRFDRSVRREHVVGRVHLGKSTPWRILNTLIVVGWVWPHNLLARFAGPTLSEKLTRTLFRLGWLVHVCVVETRSFRVERVRVDRNWSTVAELCNLDPRTLPSAFSETDSWLCYLIKDEKGRPAACLLCFLRDGRCSLEAFGYRDERLCRRLLATLQARIDGPLFSLLFANFHDQWPDSQLNWLLDSGFVATDESSRGDLLQRVYWV
jgi:hypothetical protein